MQLTSLLLSYCRCVLHVLHAGCVLLFTQVWPNLGLHYAMLAKLELLLEQPAAAARAAEAAAAILRVAHGGDAAVVHEVCRTRYEAGAELAAYARGAE